MSVSPKKLKAQPENKILTFDEYVGLRIREARIHAGESQQKLAARWGITFQQVQKYEKGTNKVSHERIYDLCRFYNLPMTYFTEGYKPGAAYYVPDDVPTNDGAFAGRGSLRIVQLYNMLDDKLKKTVLALLNTLVTEPPGASDGK